jgi:hypothetical protein
VTTLVRCDSFDTPPGPGSDDVILALVRDPFEARVGFLESAYLGV